MLYFFKQQDDFYLDFCNSNGAAPCIDAFVRSNQEYIKTRFDNIFDELKQKIKTENAKKFIQELNFELYKKIIGDSIKIYIARAYITTIQEYGSLPGFTIYNMAKKIMEKAKEKQYIKVLENAISNVDISLRKSFDIFN